MSPDRFEFACEHVSRTFRTRNGLLLAVSDVTFAVRPHEFVCVVGPSGCGKSTLLRLIAGLLRPTDGRVVFGDTPSNGQPPTALVFQEHGLFPWMTVLENVTFGSARRGVNARDYRQRALSFIASAGLAAFANYYPHELSVGMRQRVGIARAFVVDPRVLIMDEPFGSLDAQTRLVLQQELLSIWAARHNSVVYVTHDIQEAVTLGDRVLVMSGRPGRVLEDIPIAFERPRPLDGNDRPEIRELKRHIWQLLEHEVRESLRLS